MSEKKEDRGRRLTRRGGKKTRKQHLDHMHHQQQRERSRLLGVLRMKGVWGFNGFNMLMQKLAKSQSKQASHTLQASSLLPCHAPKHIFSQSLIARSFASRPLAAEHRAAACETPGSP
ncbi:hypothetical protein PBY51_009602 [Eleginops maclovinus]|uniref:Uncharacterized protein n=1 Tax=Eleginops maclovinus TaxID=56733 RepID=A0AAN8AV34_ELEMC|nr:hypothetical protein PBY51_009602 [Eleginops maclovinus]